MISVRLMYEPASLSMQRLSKKNFEKINNDITAVTEMSLWRERERESLHQGAYNKCVCLRNNNFAVKIKTVFWSHF